MRKFAFVVAIAAVIWSVPGNGNATSITLEAMASSPVGQLTFSGHTGNYYLDYDVSINGAAYDQGFCVDLYQNAPTDGSYTYNLEAVTDEYFKLAWIADTY